MHVATQNIAVPKLRFKEFSHGWENKKLGELYPKLSTGMTPSRRIPSYFKGNIPWITSGELNYNVIDDTIEKITDLAVSETNLKIYPPFTFFIAITGLEAPGTRGKCAINGVPATTNQSCLAFTKNKNINTNFLFYWYNKYGISLYFKYAQGTKQQSFNNKIVSKFEIALPTLPEQEKIASFLSSVDERIQKLERKKRLLEEYKKGVMQKIFSQELRFKDENGNKYPDWAFKKFRHLVKINQGLQIPISERYLSKVDNSHFYITNEFLKSNSEKKYYIKNPNDSVLCDVNDILMTRTGNTGMVVTNVEGAFHNNFFKIAYPNTINKNFLFYFLNQTNTQNTIKRLAGTSTIPDLNHSDFYRIEFPITDLPEQEKIASFLSGIDKKIELVETQIQQSKTFKKGLLQQMFVAA